MVSKKIVHGRGVDSTCNRFKLHLVSTSPARRDILVVLVSHCPCWQSRQIITTSSPVSFLGGWDHGFTTFFPLWIASTVDRGETFERTSASGIFRFPLHNLTWRRHNEHTTRTERTPLGHRGNVRWSSWIPVGIFSGSIFCVLLVLPGTTSEGIEGPRRHMWHRGYRSVVMRGPWGWFQVASVLRHSKTFWRILKRDLIHIGQYKTSSVEYWTMGLLYHHSRAPLI